MGDSLLRRLYTEQGQSPWLDNLRRDFLESGLLRKLIDDGVRGLTSNPTIFQKAIQESDSYDVQISEARGSDVEDVYWRLVCADIADALDVFRPLYDSSGGTDGFVSVEVDPHLAQDASGTFQAGRLLWDRLSRPNAMIKIPATLPSLPAIRSMIASGANVNVTLIFGLDRYQEVMAAYVNGLADRVEQGLPIDSIQSVASFFISRVDTEVDRRLEAVGTPQALSLRGKAAVNQAKLAYQMFTETFSGPAWEALASRGARPQRPLWASTSTKNPSFPDTMYVDQLIGPNSVNTLPDTTLEAFRDHGTLERTIDSDVAASADIWREIQDEGVDLGDVSNTLEIEGLRSFQKSFDDLLESLAEKLR